MRVFKAHSAASRLVVAAVAAGSVLFASACQDAPTVPSSATRTNARPVANIVIPPFKMTLTMRFKDVYGNLITEKPNIKWTNYGTTYGTYDNGGRDIDPAVGTVTIEMAFAPEVTVCLSGFTVRYGYEENDHCKTVTGSLAPQDIGDFVMRKLPWVEFELQDLAGKKLQGSTVHLTGPEEWEDTVTDGMTGDYSAYNGKIKVRLSRPGTYTWCETKAPTGYLLTSPTCGTFTGAWEAPDTVILLKHQKKLIYFPF